MTQTTIAYAREKDAPLLPPPPSTTGLRGWLWENMFSTMWDWSSIGSAIRSIIMMALTAVIGFYLLAGFWALMDFSLFSATWDTAAGEKRDACLGSHGACWPFIDAKWKQIVYGRYPDEELWRVNICFVILGVGVGWLVMDAFKSPRVVGLILLGIAAFMFTIYFLRGGGLPTGATEEMSAWELVQRGELLWTRTGFLIPALVGLLYLFLGRPAGRRWVMIFMLLIYPVLAFVLLTGGHFEISRNFWIGWLGVTAVLLVLGFIGRNGSGALNAFSGLFMALGAVLAFFALMIWVCTVDFGLAEVETSKWGGLLVTLVVALTGIVASLPIGILLALGRRSTLPAVRLLSVIYIEFWRGVPLITVLFMSSVMLPLFMPEGTEVDKLLRALIGVALFSSAYMAEVVRGGLQAIPSGQYEGASSLGLSFWQSMRLIILPQALTLVIPGIVNTFIGLFKDTSLVLIIGLFDLLGGVQATFTDASWSTPVTGHTGYLVAAFIFWIFCFGMSRYSMYMEQSLRRGH